MKKTREPKSLEDLVVLYKFFVNEVVSKSKEVKFTPQSEIRFGGSTPRYTMGYASTLMLKVDPILSDKKIVKTLTFNGYSPVRAGEIIEAKIPRYTFEETREPHRFISKREYFDRPFNEKESAIEITIVNINLLNHQTTKRLRTDRSVDYSYYIKD